MAHDQEPHLTRSGVWSVTWGLCEEQSSTMSVYIADYFGGLRKVQKMVSISRKILGKKDAPGRSSLTRDQPRGSSLGVDQ